MKRILTVVGARPQFIKASVISREISESDGVEEIMLHTGQHFDSNMSEVFFEDLKIPRPDIRLSINGGTHGEMTGRMLIEIERALLQFSPDQVLVYGDTNSTLAGALAASKLHIPVAHVEAGLRSFNMHMPEEINRILTDQVSDLLFCPTKQAVSNLEGEGFKRRSVQIFQPGDVMQDAVKLFSKNAQPPKGLGMPAGFVLATIHRAENIDNPENLASIVDALNDIHHKIAPVILPIHPRTRKLLIKQGFKLDVNVIDPVGYFEMLWLLSKCEIVLTDSGGLQKEAFFSGKACVTMRDQTEWVELVDIGVNELTGSKTDKILKATERNIGRKVNDPEQLYGGGAASKRIVDILRG